MDWVYVVLSGIGGIGIGGIGAWQACGRRYRAHEPPPPRREELAYTTIAGLTRPAPARRATGPLHLV
jgi:hypothetical protein